MQSTFLKLFLLLTVVPLIIIVIFTNLPLPTREKIFSAEERVPRLGLDFTLEYKVTGGHRPR